MLVSIWFRLCHALTEHDAPPSSPIVEIQRQIFVFPVRGSALFDRVARSCHAFPWLRTVLWQNSAQSAAGGSSIAQAL
eukprot:s5574_g3.t1